MGHSVFEFGALYLGNNIQHVPRQPTGNGDIPQYDRQAVISIDPAQKERITWIKPDGYNLLVADRALMVDVSWDDLDLNDMVAGKRTQIGGQCFRCRLLQLGNHRDAPNEWEQILNITGTHTDNALWNWDEMYFWGCDVVPWDANRRVIRGHRSSTTWSTFPMYGQDMGVGFRPALEPLGCVDSWAAEDHSKLDGIDFQLTSLPGGDFCPILQPTDKSVFSDIPVGSKIRMYTFMESGHPICFGEPVKDAAKLTLTDRYFGDEYLIPWTISNGVAVANQALQQQN